MSSHVARKLWDHVLVCKTAGCVYPRCIVTRELLKHYHHCKDENCPVCEPVKAVIRVNKVGRDSGDLAQLTC